MTKFFHELTIRNWGFPWHIIGTLLTFCGVFALLLLGFDVVSWEVSGHVPFVVSGALTMLAWWGYEWWQLKHDPPPSRTEARREFLEDSTANFIGVLLGALIIYILQWVLLNA